MAHGCAATVKEFLGGDEDSLIGRLARGVFNTGISELSNAQERAWRAEIRLLKEQLSTADFEDWFIILEYEIPHLPPNFLRSTYICLQLYY